MAAAVFVWWVVVGLFWQLDWQVFCSCVRGMGSGGSALRSVACIVCVIALVTRVSGIGRVCLAINAVGLLRSSTNNKIRICGWCKFGCCCFLFFFC